MLKKWFSTIRNKQYEESYNDKKIIVDDKGNSDLKESTVDVDNNETNNNENNLINEDFKDKYECDEKFIKKIKLLRAKSIEAINIYTNEIIEFKTHVECSRKLKIPLNYIKENILYGYTEYFGEAINHIGKQLGLAEFYQKNDKYLEKEKSPFETYKQLNDKIFSMKLSEEKRNLILTNSKIEPISMIYKFKCLDFEYDDYFLKYKDVMMRTGKKKIELVKKNGEILEVYKSIDECAKHLDIDKSKVQDMLRCGETKVGRNYIRYSFRKI